MSLNNDILRVGTKCKISRKVSTMSAIIRVLKGSSKAYISRFFLIEKFLVLSTTLVRLFQPTVGPLFWEPLFWNVPLILIDFPLLKYQNKENIICYTIQNIGAPDFVMSPLFCAIFGFWNIKIRGPTVVGFCRVIANTRNMK